MKIVQIIIIAIFFLSCNKISAQIITNFAGGGTILGDGGPANVALLSDPGFGAFDSIGNYFFTDGCRIRMVDTLGIIRTVVGTSCGYGGDLGPATAAKINNYCAATVDRAGNIYLADWLNYRVRKVNKATGFIHTIAGTGLATVTGDGGPATAATTVPNEGICLDKFGNVFIIDSQGVWVRKIDTFGIITRVAGNGISGFAGDSGMATSASIGAIVGLCSDTSGNLLIGCNTRIRKVNRSTGIITTIAGTGVGTYAGDGMHADSANFVEYGICLDYIGNLYIADQNNRIRKIDIFNIIHTIAGNGISGHIGDGRPATNAEFYNPYGVATDACGNLYIADNGNLSIRKVTFNPTCDPYSKGHFDSASLNVKTISTSNINIYPNPANSSITITTINKINQVIITNLIGQTVYTQAYDIEKAEVNIAGLPEGVYIVRVTDDEGKTTVSKIVKQ